MTTRDVGDGYPIGYEARDPDTGDLVDATVALTVTDPDGIATTPSPTHTSTGVYHHTITLASAGRWRWRWDVTGTVIDVQTGEVFAAASAPGDLAGVGDLVKLLGRPLTTVEAAKAPGKLASASVKLRGYCKRSFTEVTGDTITLRPIGTILHLPNKASAVTSVTQIGTAGTTDRTLSTSEWAWDGLDQIEIFPWWPCPTPNLPPTGVYANAYRIVYDHDAGGVPDFIRDMCADMALDAVMAPTETSRVNSERIGSYSYQMGQAGSGSPGAAVRLTKEQKDDLAAAGFRRRAGTTQVRAV